MRFHTRFPADLTRELQEAGLEVSDVVDHAMRGLQEDLPGDDDVDTTSVATIPEDAQAVGDFNAREPGVVAGLGIAEVVFRLVLGDDVTVSNRVPDGTHVAAGDRVMTVSGPARGLLTAERTALNFASHLSGVATTTSQWVAGTRRHACSGPRHAQDACPVGARCRSTPCAAVAASTTGSAWSTWRWSRTTT